MSGCPQRLTEDGLRYLEVESYLARHCPWSYVVRAAEGGEEVVEGVLVREVDRRDLGAPAVSVTAEEIILSDYSVEQVARIDALRIVVVVAGVRGGNRDQA